MYRHASTCWKGPVSRSRPWWQDEAGEDAGTVCLEAHPGEEREETEVRRDVVARARRLIAAGAYDDPEVLEQALGRMIQRLEMA
jgi:hypothetical protein